jgi:hypothetical protein
MLWVDDGENTAAVGFWVGGLQAMSQYIKYLS